MGGEAGRASSVPGTASSKLHSGYCGEGWSPHDAHFTDEDVGAQRLNDVAEDQQQGSERLDLAQTVPGCMSCSVSARATRSAALN